MSKEFLLEIEKAVKGVKSELEQLFFVSNCNNYTKITEIQKNFYLSSEESVSIDWDELEEIKNNLDLKTDKKIIELKKELSDFKIIDRKTSVSSTSFDSLVFLETNLSYTYSESDTEFFDRVIKDTNLNVNEIETLLSVRLNESTSSIVVKFSRNPNLNCVYRFVDEANPSSRILRKFINKENQLSQVGYLNSLVTNNIIKVDRI